MAVRLEQAQQAVEQLVVTQPPRTPGNDCLGGLEQLAIDDRREHTIGPDPHGWAVADSFPLELERDAVPDVVAGVLLVDQHLMHGAARPGSAKVGDDAAGGQGVDWKSGGAGTSGWVREGCGGRRTI